LRRDEMRFGCIWFMCLPYTKTNELQVLKKKKKKNKKKKKKTAKKNLKKPQAQRKLATTTDHTSPFVCNGW